MDTGNVSGVSNGNEGCRCTDETNILASLTERSCQTEDGQNGVMLAAKGPCVPFSYGSSSCVKHDYMHDPKCSLGGINGGSNYPVHCIRPWCYVDATSCMQSSERAFHSAFFPLYYSYTTCGSSADDWIYYQQQQTLVGKNIIAGVAPQYLPPLIFKAIPSSDILAVQEDEYYNNSVPYEGVLNDYMDALVHTSNGNFNVTYTFGSKASRLLHPTSPWTAVIQDVKDGLIDMGLGPFWITGERLKMVSFTVPMAYDRQVLVIPNPATKDTLISQTSKVLAPFAVGVWVLIVAVITLTALLSVWFSDRTLMAMARMGKKIHQLKRPKRPKKGVYARLALDEFLKKGMFFCSAGVEQDDGASLPHRLLMFGFSFFILILVSAYVANLAAFLTRNTSEFVSTVEGAVQAGLKICSHPTLRTELEIAQPDANFVFSQSGSEFYGVLDDYDKGKCDVLAISEMDTKNDIELMNMFCKKDLLFTKSLFIENPVAFPINSELASGLSYWMYQGEKYHAISLAAKQEEYDIKHRRIFDCDVNFSLEDLESSDLAQIQVQNLFAPIILFAAFTGAAIVLQIFYQRATKKGKRHSLLIGRSSSLNLFSEQDPFNHENSEDDDVPCPQERESPLAEPVQLESVVSLNNVHDRTEDEIVMKNVSLLTGSFEKRVNVTCDTDSDLFRDAELQS